MTTWSSSKRRKTEADVRMIHTYHGSMISFIAANASLSAIHPTTSLVLRFFKVLPFGWTPQSHSRTSIASIAAAEANWHLACSQSSRPRSRSPAPDHRRTSHSFHWRKFMHLFRAWTWPRLLHRGGSSRSVFSGFLRFWSPRLWFPSLLIISSHRCRFVYDR